MNLKKKSSGVLQNYHEYVHFKALQLLLTPLDETKPNSKS